MRDYHRKLIMTLVVLVSGIYAAKAQKVGLIVENIRSSKGLIVVAVFTDQDSFENERPLMRKKFNKEKLEDGKMRILLELPPGTYGISILDDENRDDYMTMNQIGLPLEGFGFSNYIHASLLKPKFNSFSFDLGKDEFKKIRAKVVYLGL